MPAIPQPCVASIDTACDMLVIEYDSTCTPFALAYSLCGNPPTVFMVVGVELAPVTLVHCATIAARFPVLTVVSLEPCQTDSLG